MDKNGKSQRGGEETQRKGGRKIQEKGGKGEKRRDDKEEGIWRAGWEGIWEKTAVEGGEGERVARAKKDKGRRVLNGGERELKIQKRSK